MAQIRRLLRHLDARLAWLGIALLALDASLIAVFSAARIYWVRYKHAGPILGEQWDIDVDWSYSEMLGYLKMITIVCLLMLIWIKWRRPVYLGFVPIFGFALLDDVFQLHERLGEGAAGLFTLQPFARLGAQDFGELIAWTAVAIPLLAGLLSAFAKSPLDDRTNGLLLLAAFAVLILFAVVADMAHIMVMGAFRGSNLLFTVIEDGGEQITLTLICGLAVLIYREVRSREPTCTGPG